MSSITEPGLESRRARRAYEIVTEVETKAKEDNDPKKFRDSFCSEANSAGVLIHNAGLMQTLAFYLGKGGAKRMLADHLLQWLYRESRTDSDMLFERMLGAEPMQLAHDTMETQAFLVWLKRFANARLKEKKDSEPDSIRQSAATVPSEVTPVEGTIP